MFANSNFWTLSLDQIYDHFYNIFLQFSILRLFFAEVEIYLVRWWIVDLENEVQRTTGTQLCLSRLSHALRAQHRELVFTFLRTECYSFVKGELLE